MENDEKTKLVATIAGNIFCASMHMMGVSGCSPPDNLEGLVQGSVARAFTIVEEAEKEVDAG